jgi:hypothetical protein
MSFLSIYRIGMNTPAYQEALRRIANIIPSGSGLLRADTLDLSRLNLTVYPPIPNSVKHFTCSGNSHAALPDLPASLKYLDCQVNQLTTIPELPASLKNILCDYNPFIAPFDRFVETFNQNFRINQLRRSIHAYYAPIKAKGRNMSVLKQSFGQKSGPLPENILTSIGSFLSGKPGTLNMQTAALKRNMGLKGGRRRTRRNRKTRKEKSRRRH